MSMKIRPQAVEFRNAERLFLLLYIAKNRKVNYSSHSKAAIQKKEDQTF